MACAAPCGPMPLKRGSRCRCRLSSAPCSHSSVRVASALPLTPRHTRHSSTRMRHTEAAQRTCCCAPNSLIIIKRARRLACASRASSALASPLLSASAPVSFYECSLVSLLHTFTSPRAMLCSALQTASISCVALWTHAHCQHLKQTANYSY